MQLYQPKVQKGGKRKSPRQPCRWPAILHVKPMNLSCVVEDISQGGCKIAVSASRLELGAVVVVDIPSQRMVLDGEVVWTRFGEAGIRFNFSEQSYLKKD